MRTLNEDEVREAILDSFIDSDEKRDLLYKLNIELPTQRVEVVVTMDVPTVSLNGEPITADKVANGVRYTIDPAAIADSIDSDEDAPVVVSVEPR